MLLLVLLHLGLCGTVLICNANSIQHTAMSSASITPTSLKDHSIAKIEIGNDFVVY